MNDLQTRHRIAGERNPEGVARLHTFEGATSLVVEAGAGAGKTTLLVGRMVALIRTGTEVGHMAAITFTRKAAGEMRSRLFMALSDAWEKVTDPREKHRIERALNHLDQLQITTIHAFCLQILQTYPLEAGLPHRFTLLEDLEASRETREAWNRAMADLRKAHPDWLPALREAGVSLNDAYLAFSALLPYPDCDVVAPEVAPPDLRDRVHTLAEALAPFMEFAYKNEIVGDSAGLVLSNLHKRLRLDGLDAFEAQARFLRELHANDLKVSDLKWQDLGKVTAIRAAFKATKEKAAESFAALAEYCAFVTVRVAIYARDHFETWRRTKGKILTDDLLHFTTRLLDTQPNVRKALQETYTTLLVDEFQDTDPAQAHILMHLAGDSAHPETAYHQQRIRAGSLFVVGDPKQSIYRFRRASIEVFEQVRTQIEQSSGERLLLTTNFRSLPTLCDWFNTAFSSLFKPFSSQEGSPAYGPRYEAFEAGRSLREGLALHRITAAGKLKTAEVVRQDAERIAQCIRAHVDGRDARLGVGRSWGDFMVLTYSRTHLAAYAEALSRLHIPYTVTGERGADKSEALATLHDLLRVLRRPGDGFALVAFLRGLLGGCSDKDLYLFAEAGGKLDSDCPWEKDSIPHVLDAEVAERFRKVFHTLREARDAFRTQPLLLAFQSILDQTGLLVAARLLPGGEREAGLLIRLRSRVEALAAEGGSWLDLEEELGLYRKGDVELPGMSLLEGSPNAVRLMNVHQAKGLQAPVVFLACPTQIRDSADKVDCVVVRPNAGRPNVYVYRKSVFASPDYAMYAEKEEMNEAAEVARLLYVAATRAEDHLIVSRDSDNKGPWEALFDHFPDSAEELTPLETADPAAMPDLRGQEVGALKPAEPWRDEVGFTLKSVTSGLTESEALLQNVGRSEVSESRKVAQQYGTALHLVLEQVIRTKNHDRAYWERFVQASAEGNDLNASNVQRLGEALDRFLTGSLWAELHLATQILTEVPFAYPLDEKKGVTGIIDLAYLDERGWHVVDFKTKKDNIPQDLPPEHPYAQQVYAYGQALSKTVGVDVASHSIWFTENGTRVFV